MTILYYWPEQDRYMDKWQRIHFFDELEKYGHIIEVFNPLNYENLIVANEIFIKNIKSRTKLPDLFMTCAGSNQIFKETIQTVKKKGIPSLLICFDNLHAPFMHKKVAPLFDIVWLTSQETEHMFKKWGCNSIFMPYAANPFKFQINIESGIAAIGFIGTPYGARAEKINLLTKHDVKCNVYTDTINSQIQPSSNYHQLLMSFYNLSRFAIGRKVIWGAIKKKFSSGNIELEKNDFLCLNPSVSFSEMNKLYSDLALSLGITELRNTYALKRPVHKIHLRTFEIPMCGGLQLTSHTPELENYFENDKEILLYKDNGEMISKAKFYLNPNNAKQRMKIKLAARKRAEGEHTWMKRFNKIFKHLKL